MIGLKGIGGQAILPFLETPGSKVQIMMIIYVGKPPVCRTEDLLVATVRLSSGNKCPFHYQSHPYGKRLTNFRKSTIICTDTTALNCCALEKG